MQMNRTKTYTMIQAYYLRPVGVSHGEGTKTYMVIWFCSQPGKVQPRLIFGTTNPSPDLPFSFSGFSFII